MQTLTKASIDLNEWEFEFQQRNRNCVLMADMHSRGLYFNFPEEVKLDIPPFDYIFTDSSKGYVKREQKAEVIQKIRKAITDDKYLRFVMDNSISKMEKFDRLTKRILREVQNPRISNKQLAEAWQTIDDGYRKMMPWFYIPWYISEYNMLSERVRDGLSKHKRDIEKIIDLTDALLTLIFPVKKAAFQNEQRAFFEIVTIAEKDCDFEKSDEFKKKARQYLRYFAWMKTFFFLPIDPLSEAELVAKVRDALKTDSGKDFRNQQAKLKRNAEKARKLLLVVSNDLCLVRDISWARELGWVLTTGVDAATRGGSRLPDILGAIAPRVGLTKEEMPNLTSDEITSALQGRRIDKKELVKRNTGYILAHIAGRTLFTSGQEGKNLSKRLDNETNKAEKGVTEFGGQSASRGRVKGMVRITPTPEDSYSLREGEILVCSMTDPNYVPAMKRAAAIVTVEGGLLSHAAIMSREFGKPCIVGTKIAMKVLKDGDLVEVDANKGIVKIIKRAGRLR